MAQTKIYKGNFKGPKFVKWMKPKQYAHYKTIGELSQALHVDPQTLRRLEWAGITPEPVRVTRGRLRIRLFSPQNEREIEEILKKREYRKKPGRKPNAQ